jgi:hypothetical protein
MPTTLAGRQIVAAAAAANYAFLALHTTTGAAGTGELTGGSPAYARVAPRVDNTANNGSSKLSATFNVPPNMTVVGWSAWTAAVGGTLIDGGQMAGPQGYVSQGTYDLLVSLVVQ